MSAAERIAEPAAYVLRAPREGDTAYIFATWMRWARKFAPWLRLLPDRVFWSDRLGYRAHVESLLRRSMVRVACDPDAPDSIFGYVVAEPPRLLHFVFVDRMMRGRAGGTLPESIGVGLVRSVLPTFGSEQITTTLDRPAMIVAVGKWNLRFDPFAAPIVGGEFNRWARAWRESVSNVGSNAGSNEEMANDERE